LRTRLKSRITKNDAAFFEGVSGLRNVKSPRGGVIVKLVQQWIEHRGSCLSSLHHTAPQEQNKRFHIRVFVIASSRNYSL